MTSQDISAKNVMAGGNIENVNSNNVTHSGTGNIYLGLPDQSLRELANWISDLDFSLYQSQVFERYTKGTLLWVFQEPAFVTWLEKPGMLWCPGKPGAGKSVFASFVVNHLQKHSEIASKAAVCYLYCRYHTTLSTLQLFAAILSQLVLRCSLPKSVFERIQFAKERKERLTVDDILSLLKESSLQIPNIFIVLDALDECFDEQIRHQVLLYLQELTSIHILITSRPLPIIESAIGNVPVLYISAQDQDIQTYMEAVARSNPRLAKIIPKDDRRADVEAKVIEKADGTFLLAHLHTERLAQQLNTSDLLRVAEDLPKEAAQSYEATLERIRERDENEKRLAFCALSWVLHGPDLLTPTELSHALVVDLDRMATEDDLTDAETIVSSCAGLIVVNRVKREYYGPETLAVTFLHYTVQEFLEATWTTTTDLLSDVQVTLCCMKVVSFPDIQLDYPFFHYAASAWGPLVQLHESDEEVQQLAMSQLQDPSTLGTLGAAWPTFEQSHHPTILHHLARFGLIRLYEALLSTMGEGALHYSINEPDECGWPALHWAVSGWHLPMVKKLLAVPSIEVNFRDTRGRTTLFYALGSGYLDIVQELLSHPGIDVDLKDTFNTTSLTWAIGSGQSEVVRELLHHNTFDIDSRDTCGATPFSYAAQIGQLDAILEVLRHPGIDIDSKDDSGRTPLSWAAEWGRVDVVRELLRHPTIDIESRDGNRRTPLSWAVGAGYTRLEVVQELLRHPEVDVNSKDSSGRTPLSWAAEWGPLEVLQELLNHPTIDIDPKDNTGRTPFSWAAGCGRLEAVQEMLRQPGIDGDSKDAFDATPLTWAIFKGHLEVIQELCQYPGIDIDSKDRDGRTPLSWAAGSDHTRSEIVEELLRHPGVDIDSKDIGGRTPLSWAAEWGHPDVVQELLHQPGIDVDSTDGGGRTPLSCAAEWGRLEVIQELLHHTSVNVNFKDTFGATPLIWAVSMGHLAVVWELLNHPTIDVNSKDITGRTPLSWAADAWRREFVQELLRHSAVDVNSQDINGRTPLSWAAKYGHLEVVQELLQHPGINVDSIDTCGATAFSYAAQEGRLEVVQELLRHPGIDLDSKDGHGRTPLSWAAGSGHYDVVQELLCHSSVDINSQDTDCRTPLFWAVASGSETVVGQLVNHPDIIVNCRDTLHLTPLIWATFITYSDSVMSSKPFPIVDLLMQTCKFELPGKRRFSAVTSAGQEVVSHQELGPPRSPSLASCPADPHFLRKVAPSFSPLTVLHRPAIITHRQILGLGHEVDWEVFPGPTDSEID